LTGNKLFDGNFGGSSIRQKIIGQNGQFDEPVKITDEKILTD